MKLRDWVAVVIGLLVIAALIAYPLWYLFGSCDSLDWLPIAYAPTRCLR